MSDTIDQQFNVEGNCDCPDTCTVTKYKYDMSFLLWPTNNSLVSQKEIQTEDKISLKRPSKRGQVKSIFPLNDSEIWLTEIIERLAMQFKTQNYPNWQL